MIPTQETGAGGHGGLRDVQGGKQRRVVQPAVVPPLALHEAVLLLGAELPFGNRVEAGLNVTHLGFGFRTEQGEDGRLHTRAGEDVQAARGDTLDDVLQSPEVQFPFQYRGIETARRDLLGLVLRQRRARPIALPVALAVTLEDQRALRELPQAAVLAVQLLAQLLTLLSGQLAQDLVHARVMTAQHQNHGGHACTRCLEGGLGDSDGSQDVSAVQHVLAVLLLAGVTQHGFRNDRDHVPAGGEALQSGNREVPVRCPDEGPVEVAALATATVRGVADHEVKGRVLALLVVRLEGDVPVGRVGVEGLRDTAARFVQFHRREQGVLGSAFEEGSTTSGELQGAGSGLEGLSNLPAGSHEGSRRVEGVGGGALVAQAAFTAPREEAVDGLGREGAFRAHDLGGERVRFEAFRDGGVAQGLDPHQAGLWLGGGFRLGSHREGLQVAVVHTGRFHVHDFPHGLGLGLARLGGSHGLAVGSEQVIDEERFLRHAR